MSYPLCSDIPECLKIKTRLKIKIASLIMLPGTVPEISSDMMLTNVKVTKIGRDSFGKMALSLFQSVAKEKRKTGIKSRENPAAKNHFSFAILNPAPKPNTKAVK